MEYYDYMIDVETGGTHPEHSPMIQLSAVRFNLQEGTIDTSSMFNRCLLIPAGRFWDEDTRQWWARQKRSVLEEIYARMEDPKLVMEGFVDWVGFDAEQPKRFWSKPLSFDWPFVASYFRQFGVINPFHYRFGCDVNSFIRGLARDSSVETFKTEEFHGDQHNALHDCINQIDMIFKAKEHYANV